jgi:hypothetical protein
VFARHNPALARHVLQVRVELLILLRGKSPKQIWLREDAAVADAYLMTIAT